MCSSDLSHTTLSPRRHERHGRSASAPRPPLVGEPGTPYFSLTRVDSAALHLIPSPPPLLLCGCIGGHLSRFCAGRRHGPVPYPQRGGDSPRRPREDHADGPAPAAVRRRHPPRARHGLHQPRARARHHYRFQGHFCPLEGE